MTTIPVGATVKYAFRQRGYNDETQGNDTAHGRELAERAGKDAVEAYMTGVRAARQKKKETGGAE